MVKMRLETKIDKILTINECKLTLTWKQEITCRTSCLFVNKNATKHKIYQKRSILSICDNCFQIYVRNDLRKLARVTCWVK